MKNFFLLSFVFWGLVSFAQSEKSLSVAEAKSYFNEIGGAYQAGLSFKAHYRSYAGETSSKVQDEYTGRTEVSSSQTYYELPGSIIYSNAEFMVQVIVEEKKIYVSRNKSQDVKLQFEVQFDNFLKNASSIMMRSLINGGKAIHIFMNNSFEYESIVYEFDTYDRVSKITMITNGVLPIDDNNPTENLYKGKVVVEYSDYKKLSSSQHAINDVLSNVDGKWLAKGLYSDFEVIELKNY